MISTAKQDSVTNAATPKRVIVYATPKGQEPFSEWLDGWRDRITQKRILASRIGQLWRLQTSWGKSKRAAHVLRRWLQSLFWRTRQ